MPSNRSEFLLHVEHVEGEDSRTVIRFPAGTALSESNAEELARQLLAAADAKERPHLMVDLGGVSLLTSVILAKLLSVNGHVRSLGGRFTLFNPNTTVYQVFKVTRLDTILEVHSRDNPVPV